MEESDILSFMLAITDTRAKILIKAIAKVQYPAAFAIITKVDQEDSALADQLANALDC